MRINRREFSLLSAAAIASSVIGGKTAEAVATEPWYSQVKRWGQVNITEDNAVDFDMDFWRDYWRKTHTEGMIWNAGGFVAYYPTKVPYHRRAPLLGNRDLFGELMAACNKDGVTVLARLSHYASDELLEAHPDWCNVDAQGRRLKTPCMNGGFTYDYCAQIVQEIASTYRPAGFTLSGWNRNYALCYCETCKLAFKQATGQELPIQKNWDDPVYRQWIDWNSDQAVALWDHGNKIAQAAGGPDCLWIGQLVGIMTGRDTKRLCERAKLVMLDHQGRADATGFQENTDAGKVVQGLVGWDTPIAEASAISSPRLASKPAAEVQLWMYEGIAAGMTPWWHTIGAYHEDKRQYATALPVLSWHKHHQEYLYNRRPVATVGVVWSETNNVFYGRDDTAERVLSPWRGMVNALVRARIPYVAVHADHIDRDAENLATLILPNVAALTESQVASIKRFVAHGGGLFATGESSLYDQFGDRHADYALADLFAAHWKPIDAPKTSKQTPPDAAAILAATGIGPLDMPALMQLTATNSYLRLTPELRAQVAGAHSSSEPAVVPGVTRHPVLNGFEETDILYFGGVLPPLIADAHAQVLMTYVPPSPISPAENSWLRVPKTNIPALIVNVLPGSVAFLPADLDRQYDHHHLPDPADLIANIVRWTAGDNIPLAVHGPGLIDCNLYQQAGRMIVHLANLNSSPWRAPVEDFVPIGQIKVRVKLNKDVKGRSARLLVAGKAAPVIVSNGWTEITIPTITAHEVVVLV
jgi:Hypothetical glycosyl hydrolase 6